MLEVLVPGEVKAKYTFDSIAFKDISRTTDGFLQPDDPKTDRFLLEFQVKHDWSLWTDAVDDDPVPFRQPRCEDSRDHRLHHGHP